MQDMQILKEVGKVAGIGGLALGVFLLLFKDVIRRNIFAKLPPQETFRIIRLILILVWSIAIIGIAAWLIAPLLAQPAQTKNKIVITMDSPLLVFDPENKGTGRTNTDEIDNALKDVKGISLDQVSTNLLWNREEEVRTKDPDLIIIHWSAFASDTMSSETRHQEERKFISFVQYMADTKAKFLVYSRSPLLETAEDQQAWVQQMERRVPNIKGRIQFFNFPPGEQKGFRDPEVQRELKRQVKSMLGIS